MVKAIVDNSYLLEKRSSVQKFSQIWIQFKTVKFDLGFFFCLYLIIIVNGWKYHHDEHFKVDLMHWVVSLPPSHVTQTIL